MKLYFLTVLFTCLLGVNSTIGQDLDFTIKGKTSRANDGSFVKLYYKNDTTKVVDSVRVSTGRFQFKGKLVAPTLGKLSFQGEDFGDGIDLFLSSGSVSVVTKDSLKYAKISGTALAESHERYAAKVRSKDAAYIDALTTFRAMPEGQEKKEYSGKLMDQIDILIRSKREAAHQFVEEEPDSYVALYHLEKTAFPGIANYETTYPFYDKLSQRIKSTVLGQELASRLLAAKGNLTGKAYIDFVSLTPDGHELRLSDVLQESKYILVDFWASWCGPCRKENPYVVKTYEAFKSSGFTVLSVSLDDNKGRWEEAIQQDNMPWHHVSNLKGWKEPAAQLYDIKAIPQNFLIDSSGKVVATNLRGETLFNKVQQLLR